MEEGKEKGVIEKISTGFTGDILYILQDTNKIQEGRIGYLPKYLDLITNIYFIFRIIDVVNFICLVTF